MSQTGPAGRKSELGDSMSNGGEAPVALWGRPPSIPASHLGFCVTERCDFTFLEPMLSGILCYSICPVSQLVVWRHNEN